MKRLLIPLVVLLALVMIAIAGVAYFTFVRVQQPFQAYAGDEQFLDVAPGSGPATIGRQLADAGVVPDERTFRIGLWLSGRARELKAGEYRFDQPMSTMQVIDKLARGDVYRRFITFREGLTIWEKARVFEQSGLGSADDFERAARDPALIRDLDPEAPDLEGYLFPDTYDVRRETTAEALVAQMVASFRRVFTPDLQAEARVQELTVRQTVSLAAIIEKETSVPDERPIVSAVFHNRRRLRMPMQADPTVIYALLKAGRYDGNIRRDDLRIDSPYNTYRYPGFPPGPIAAPGRASLEAAVRPADVEYIYFVSRNDGSHVFARTLQEHNRNVYEWQIQYFRNRGVNPSVEDAPAHPLNQSPAVPTPPVP